ncbi:MAG: ankyrin repeat domain-containing protein [Legionellaceae bacterium]|nr:ankyrin repeat domain-containing protein [Legionellaceae bacterium]
MPKGKNKSKTRSKPTEIPTSAPESSAVSYYKNVVIAFNELYKDYLQTKLEPADHYLSKIAHINNMHITDSESQGLPALCCYILRTTLKGEHFEFFNAMKNAGLTIRFRQAIDIILVNKALQTQDILLLDWLLVENGMNIPDEKSLPGRGASAFENGILQILDFVEKNLASDKAQYFIEVIERYHISGNTILHLAAIHNKPKLFISLANENNINQPNYHGITPAMFAVAYEESELKQVLMSEPLADHLDVSIVTNSGETIFHKIILGKDEVMFRFAANKLAGQEIDFTTFTTHNGHNIIYWAITKRQCSLLYELSRVVNLESPGLDDAYSLIYFAFCQGEPDMGYHIANACRLSLEDIRFEDGRSIPQIVIEKDNLGCFEWLVNEGYFDPGDKSKLSMPALLLAAKSKSTRILAELIEGYTLLELHSLEETPDGKRFGHYLAEHNLKELIQILLDCNELDLCHKDKNGDTIIDIALQHGDSHLIIQELCLEYIEKYALSKRKKLPIRLSEINQLPNLLNLYFADKIGSRLPNIDGIPPLHLACLNLEIDNVLTLIKDRNIDVNQRNSDGDTTLCMLVKKSSLLKAMQFIEKIHPKLTALDTKESSLLQLACEYNLEELVDWCLEMKNFSITKPRKDKFSSLDLVLIKRNSTILHKLWPHLATTQRDIYIKILVKKKEYFLLNYLTNEGLYELEKQQTTETEPPLKETIEPPLEKEDISETTLNQDDKIKIEPPSQPFVCDRKSLFEAIEKNCDYDYFRRLKHYPEHYELIQEDAQALLIAAINTQNYRLVYHLLRIAPIKDQAHAQDNFALTLACKLGQKNIVEALLRIDAIAASLETLDHPALTASIENKHVEIFDLLEDYIELNSQTEHHKSNDFDEYTRTTAASESSLSSMASSSNGELSRASTSLSSQSDDTDKDKNSPVPFARKLPKFSGDRIFSEKKSCSKDEPTQKSENLDILATNFSELSAKAEVFDCMPKCFTYTREMYNALMQISSNFHRAGLDGYTYGSVNFKLKPGDIDILIPASSMEFERDKIGALINIFISQGGRVTAKDPQTGTDGYSYEGRHVIPMEWQGLILEFVVYPKTILQHAYELDTTRSARYFSVRTFKYAETPGIYSLIDIIHKRIQTVTDAYQSFLKDPRRIFRAIQQMGDEQASLSDECLQAIQDLFSGNNNPFITHITPGKIYYRMEVMLKTGHAERYFTIFDRLGIFNKLLGAFRVQGGYSAMYYANILEPFYTFFEQQRKQSQAYYSTNSSLVMFSTPTKEISTEDRIVENKDSSACASGFS